MESICGETKNRSLNERVTKVMGNNTGNKKKG